MSYLLNTPPSPRRRGRVSMLTALATVGGVALALGLAGPAAAHNAIVSATPSEGEVLTAVPEAFEIVTNEVMLDLGGNAAGFGMLVTDEQGLYFGDGCITVDGDSMTMPATLGAPGDYTFTFQYVSADGHSLSGEYPFSYLPAEEELFSPGSSEPPVCGETGTEPEPSAPATPTETPEPTGTATAEPSAEPTDAPADEAADTTSEGLSTGVIVALVAAALAAIVAVVAGTLGRRRGTRTP